VTSSAIHVPTWPRCTTNAGKLRSTSHATSVEHFFGKNLTLWTSRQPEEPSAAGRQRGLRSGTGHRGVDKPLASQQSLHAHMAPHRTIPRTPSLRETPRLLLPLTATSQPAALSPTTMPSLRAASKGEGPGVKPADVAVRSQRPASPPALSPGRVGPGEALGAARHRVSGEASPM
jgi:hypothetical protein